MSSDEAIDRVRSELSRAFDRTHADLERVEILAAGLAAFSTPIPLTSRGSITCSDPIARRTSCRRSENRRADFSPFFEHEDGPETPRPAGADSAQKRGEKSGDFEAAPL